MLVTPYIEVGLGISSAGIPHPLRLNVSYCNDSIAAPLFSRGMQPSSFTLGM